MADQLADGVWYLDLGLIKPFASNAFLVDDGVVQTAVEGASEQKRDDPAEGGLTLVDTGTWWNEPSIREELADAGFGPGDLDRMLLTHYDLDHVGGLKRLLAEFDGPVFLGRPDFGFLRYDEQPAWAHDPVLARLLWHGGGAGEYL